MSATKIAIIEDDMAISQMYRLKFEAEGYEVETAENGKVGLELAEAFKPDIILLDLMMPEMTGDEMLTELRKKPWGKDIRVVIFTNISQEEMPSILASLDVSGYVNKASSTPQIIVEKVQKLL